MEDNLKSAFDIFSQNEGAKDGKINFDGVKKWLKQSGITGKDTGITDSDVDTALSKSSKDKKTVDLSELKECMKNISQDKKIDVKEILTKLSAGGAMKSVKQGVEDVKAKFGKEESK
ncbi:uncharacterized protein CDAR_432761 [Caerostris darwini]|uniref:Uncharacterized protein n=1 Tax=Caerostris darwini TaxID=1538125 RepID=A0AAV4QHZ3_9ARAC|nr:uncharacterized protein CDAR_432761 [Caerostris darwini]